ncbi:photosystem reaction center subunit H, partial [Marinitenerispora sediminis]
MAAPPGPAGRLADDRVTGRPSPVATAIAAGALAALIGAAVAAGGHGRADERG